MELSDRTKFGALGAVGGAVVLAMVGYSWDFFLTPAEVESFAEQRSKKAVATALAPFCVDRFRREPDAAAKLAELRKLADPWTRASFVEKGGWSKLSGNAGSDTDIANACAEKLVGSAGTAQK